MAEEPPRESGAIKYVCVHVCMYVCNSLHLFCYFKNVRKLFSFSLFLLTNILSPPKGLLVAPNLNLSEE